MRPLRAALGALAAAVLLIACSGPQGSDAPDPTAAPTGDGDRRIAVVTHGTAGDAFWNVVRNGAEAAGSDLGLAIDYTADGDPSAQSRLIDNAVAQGVDGLVVSMANPDALEEAVRKAADAGIPVVTINSGSAQSTEFGAIAHVGQEETIAGEQAGERLAEEGKTKLLCVIHEAGNVGLRQRCDGADTGFGTVQNLQVDITNPTDIEARIRGALQADDEIDAVLTLNPQVATLAASAVQAASSDAQVATFDLNPDVVAAIKAGDLLFAVDQQQYEQGYLPVVFLKLYLDNANTVGGGRPVLTGPGFVDGSNVDRVGEYAERGTR